MLPQENYCFWWLLRCHFYLRECKLETRTWKLTTVFIPHIFQKQIFKVFQHCVPWLVEPVSNATHNRVQTFKIVLTKVFLLGYQGDDLKKRNCQIWTCRTDVFPYGAKVGGVLRQPWLSQSQFDSEHLFQVWTLYGGCSFPACKSLASWD